MPSEPVNRPPHVLYIVERWPSATETFIEQEVLGLRQLGLCIDVYAMQNHAWDYSIRNLPRMKSLWRRLDVLPPILRLRAIQHALVATMLHPDSQHFHGAFLGLPSIVAYAAAQISGKQFSVSAHANDIFVARTPIEVIGAARFRTVCTETHRAFLTAKYPDYPFELIRHGVAPSLFEHASKTRVFGGTLQIIAAGRLVEKKGFIYLIEACRILKTKGVSFCCQIIGEGPLRARLDKAIQEAGLSSQVQVVEFLPNVKLIETMARSDVVVVPSINLSNGDCEGIPNVLLEAVAVGVPVVATNSGAMDEVVSKLPSVAVCEQRNASAIADAILALRNSARSIRELTDQSRRFVQENFGRERWLRVMLRHFQSDAAGA